MATAINELPQVTSIETRRGLLNVVKDAFREVTTGSRSYHIWMGALTLVMCLGAFAYSVQLTEGLSVTGMHDRVSWGFYISNFAFSAESLPQPSSSSCPPTSCTTWTSSELYSSANRSPSRH